MIDGKFDVRFFGAQHSRALIEPNYVKAIDVPPTNQKHSAGLQTAIKELEKHQELLAYPVGTFSYATEKINRELAKQAKKATKTAPNKKISVEAPKTPTRKATADTPKTPTRKATVETPKTPTRKATADTPKTPTRKVTADTPKTPTRKVVAAAAAKKKGDALESQPPAKRQKVEKKLAERTTRTSLLAQTNSDQSMINGLETRQLRGRSKSQESPVSVATNNVETPRKRKIGVAKLVEDVRESSRKKGKNSLEGQSNG
jgi:hypothetical protein